MFQKANIEVFAWMPFEILGINPSFIKHELNVMAEAWLMKQQGRRSTAEYVDAVIEGVEKLKEASTIT